MFVGNVNHRLNTNGTFSVQQPSFTQSLLSNSLDDENETNSTIAKPNFITTYSSPIYTSRNGAKIDTVVIHITEGKTFEQNRDYLTSKNSGVSANFLISKKGEILCLVPEKFAANHAGVSSWKGKSEVKFRSVGIELFNEGPDGDWPNFPEDQMKALIELCRYLKRTYNIPIENFVGHSDIATERPKLVAGRKTDPGVKFDWKRMAEAGFGDYVDNIAINANAKTYRLGDIGPAVREVQSLLKEYGYDIQVSGKFDEKMQNIMYAFNDHHYPKKENPKPGDIKPEADPTSVAILTELVKRKREREGNTLPLVAAS
ncbi:MAG: N-acetylmuramoyl-L-alanine amidase [Pseudomonadota bacterium]